MKKSRLRFNFGFLLESGFGTIREVDLSYPDIEISPDLKLSPLQGTFTATRTTEGIYIHGTLESQLIRECERCLEEAIVPVSITLDELFYYPPELAPAGENVIGEDGHLDLAPLVRELMLLEVPIRIVCRPDCQGLCQECGQNLNEGDCGCTDDELDPRLAVLAALLPEKDE